MAHKFPVSAFKEALHHRRRTLPANGAVIQFGSRQMLREVKLKETCRDNEIICVYKIKTPDGDVSGYYNTNSEWFYSMLDGSDYMDLHDQITHLILWLYTSLVCDVPDLLPTDDSFRRSFITREGVPTDLKFLTLGGKPRNYLKKDDGEDSTQHLRQVKVRCIQQKHQRLCPQTSCRTKSERTVSENCRKLRLRVT